MSLSEIPPVPYIKSSSFQTFSEINFIYVINKYILHNIHLFFISKINKLITKLIYS